MLEWAQATTYPATLARRYSLVSWPTIPGPLTPCLPCRVDLVLVGAEAVVENGGAINKLGTYQVWAGRQLVGLRVAWRGRCGCGCGCGCSIRGCQGCGGQQGRCFNPWLLPGLHRLC